MEGRSKSYVAGMFAGAFVAMVLAAFDVLPPIVPIFLASLGGALAGARWRKGRGEDRSGDSS